MPSPTRLLAEALRADPSRPFVTSYDASGARVELSVATFDTWVAKTAGMLVDDLGVEPEDVVSVLLPAHWVGLVWAQAVWTVGAHLALAPDGRAAVAVRAAPAAPVDAGTELVVVRTDPLAGPVGPSTPPGATDYGREVLGQPDRFTRSRETTDPLLRALVAEGEEHPRGTRLLVLAADLSADVVRRALLVPLLSDGSSVLVSAGTDPGRVAVIAAEERAVTTGPR